VMKKKDKQWFEKWVEKTLQKVIARFKKYGITNQMLKEYLSKKWLENLYVEF
jgi:peptidyl-tRNA hydrolase